MSPSLSYLDRFNVYFTREVAEKAAKSLSSGAEIEFQILDTDGKPVETLTFTRSGGKNVMVAGAAKDPQVTFQMPTQGADDILSDPTEDIGAIGVGIAKLIVSSDSTRRVSIKLNAGFLTLFGKGYFGVLTSGGTAFASFLASRGLNGTGAIKAAVKKMKG